MRAVFVIALASSLFACSHDLDKLTSARGKVTAVHERDADRPQLDPDAGSSTPDAAKMAGSPTACEPCDSVNDAGLGIGLHSCCRGIGNRECGLTFAADGMPCLARDVPGQSDSACTNVKQGPLMLEGCCRPDGRCGLVGEMFSLGCAARDDVLLQLGAVRADPIPCAYECQVDNDCSAALGRFACAEDPKDTTRMHRMCVKECSRDDDCVKGQVCALGNDLALDRVQSFCQTPIGTGDTGDFCSTPRDCGHGVCLLGADPTCSQLCATNGDCPKSHPFCEQAKIDSPKKSKTMVFGICQVTAAK